MIFKKLTLISIVLSSITFTALVGCKQEPQVPETITVKEVKIGDGTFSNGSLDIDPTKVSTIDLIFPEPMNTYYTGWVYYVTNGEIQDFGWKNEYTFRFDVNLTYDVNYKFVINDDEYESDTYTPQNSYWRSKEGKIAKKIIITFKTKESSLQHPYTHKIKLDYITNEIPIKLEDNRQWSGDKPNQQLLAPLNQFLNHEKVKAGDTIEFEYKIRVDNFAKSVNTNIIERSYWENNNWRVLNRNKDVAIIDEKGLEGSTASTPICKEGTLTFNIVEDMLGDLNLQIYTLFADNPNLVTLYYVPYNN